MRPSYLHFVALIWLLLTAPIVHAQSAAVEDRELKTLVNQLASLNQTITGRALAQLLLDPNEKALAALIALRDGALRATIDKSAVIIDPRLGAIDALTGSPLKPTASLALKPVPLNNQLRRMLKTAVPLAQLQSADVALRREAAIALQGVLPQESIANIHQILTLEPDLGVRQSLLIALAPYDLQEGNEQRQLEILRALLAQGTAIHQSLLRDVLTRIPGDRDHGHDLAMKTLAEDALSRIERRIFIAEHTGNLLYGVSLGSVLLLTSLGLAITLGLMGVINMAHGELLMLGAYATFVVQNLFSQHYPEYFQFYLLAAIPVAFIVAAIAGMIMERCVLRYLYGRPLETLLATWGISLILIQTVRLSFGASNVEVANPTWLSGSIELNGALLPTNRIFCIGFTIVVCLLTWLLFQKTRFGLEVRAISQNRLMAAAGGVSTGRIDMLTFAFGSGIAGLAGLVLTQLGNVGPELGQGYIVDSFLVVVFGGVGKIVGTVFAALSLGVVNKLLEPVIGAVLGKIIVLFLLVLFIQRRPQGLYSIQLREVEA